jgi:recombination protein RecA
MAEKVTKDIAKTIQNRLNDFLHKDKSIKSVMQDKPTLIRSGISTLDTILGGGIILGGFIQLVGRAGCGKSSLAAKFISSFQKLSNSNCIALYIDTETTMSKFRLSQLGVNNPLINPISDVTLEDIFGIIDSVIEFKKDNKDARDIPTIIVWDSIASTLTKKEFTAEDPKEVIGYKARLLSLYMPKIASSLQEYKITVVAVNQLRDSVGISMMPSPVAIKGMKQSDTIPGGRALQFATSQLLYMTDVGNLEERIYGFDGKEVEIYCIKNKAFPPLIKTKTSFSYMGGYSNFWSAFSILKENKLIVASGAWYGMEGYEKKFQGANVSNLYINDENFRSAFDELLKKHIKSVCDKYINQLQSCNIDDIISKKTGTAIAEHILEDKEIKESMDKVADANTKNFEKEQESEKESMDQSKEAQKHVLENLKNNKKDDEPKEPSKDTKDITKENVLPPPETPNVGGIEGLKI